MIEPGGQDPQDSDIRIVLYIENAAHDLRLHHVGVAQYTKQVNEAVSLRVVGNCSGFVEHDVELARLDRVDDDLGMGGDDELRALPGGRGPQLVIDGVLENDVQMRVRLVQQQHRTRSRVEKRQQHQHLLKTAPGARDVQNYLVLDQDFHGFALSESAASALEVEKRTVGGPVRPRVTRNDMRPAAVGRPESVPEELPYGRLKRFPRVFVAAGFRQQVAQHLARRPRPRSCSIFAG